MSEASRAEQVVELVKRHFPQPDNSNGHLRLIDAWADGSDLVRVVYEGWWFPGKLGLRRRLEPHLEVWQEAANIIDGELGEPPGAMVKGVRPDENGVTWWWGDLPEWRRYR